MTEEKEVINKITKVLKKGSYFLYTMSNMVSKEDDTKYGRPIYLNELSQAILLNMIGECIDLTQAYNLENSITKQDLFHYYWGNLYNISAIREEKEFLEKIRRTLSFDNPIDTSSKE